MKQVIFASSNQGKIKEVASILEKFHVSVKSLADIGYLDDIEETGDTFEENALIKARAIANRHGLTVIADDSGLEIDALGGAPGVYSARYAGEPKCDDANIEKVLKELTGRTDKSPFTARFVCVLVVVTPEGEETVVRGTCEGVIIDELRGAGGFGYDPIFYLPEKEKTMAELTQEEKNAISHRAQAFEKLTQYFNEMGA